MYYILHNDKYMIILPFSKTSHNQKFDLKLDGVDVSDSGGAVDPKL